MGMTESQRIVLNIRAKLSDMGWPKEAQREIVQQLCEAGYRQCIEDIQAKQDRNERIIQSAQQGANEVMH